MRYEFRSFMRLFEAGADYVSAAEILNDLGAQGWQLVTVLVMRGKYENEVGEIFYMQRQVTGAGP